MNAVDLFSGCGGMSQGFMDAGIDVVAAFDNWKPAVQTYNLNFDHQCIDTDLSNIEASIQLIKPFHPDLIFGGSPCQDFSIAGKRKESDKANMTVKFAEIVGIIEPQLFVMENVYNIEKSDSLKKAKKILIDAGYGLTGIVIDASLTGVPQKRKRYFLIGSLGGSDDSFLSEIAKNLSNSPLTIREHFGNDLNIDHYYAHPRSYKRRGVYSVDEPSATIRRVNRPIPSTYKQHPADSSVITPSIRPLTTQERSKLQTFPETFKFQGSQGTQEHLIANAVPVKLAEFVAKCTLRSHQSVSAEFGIQLHTA